MKEEKEGESVAPASPPPDSVAPGGEDRRRKVGQRIPEGWQPDQAGIAFARSEGLDPGRVLERFRDYWAGKAGQAACKTDWPATWRNWCREDADRKKPMGQFNRPAMTPAQQSSVEIMDFVRRMSGTGPEPQPPQYDFDVGLSSGARVVIAPPRQRAKRHPPTDWRRSWLSYPPPMRNSSGR